MPRTLNRNATTREKSPKNLWITQKSIHRVRGLKRAQEAEDQRKQSGSRKTQKRFRRLPWNQPEAHKLENAEGPSEMNRRGVGLCPEGDLNPHVR